MPQGKKSHLRLVRWGEATGPSPVGKAPSRGSEADEVIDGVVSTLTTLVRGAGIEMALKIGEIVVEGIYGGDLEALRKRGPKDTSLRKLAAHPRLPFAPATLWRSVAVYELVRRMPGLAHTKHLGVAHLRAALGLPQSIQERLLKAAETERWTKDKLEDQAARYRKKEKVKRGRRPLLPPIKYLRQLDRIASKAAKDVDVIDFRGLDEVRRRDVQDRLVRIRAWCAAVERALARGDGDEETDAGLETAG